MDMEENMINERKTMKGILLANFGGYDAIKIEELPFPQVNPDNMLVEMKACGLNFSDLYIRQGLFTFQNIKPPFILGSEGAGIVLQVGENVKEFKVGDRVMCWNFRYGMWAEFAEVPKGNCYLIPNEMSYAEAVCMTTNFVTAYLAVIDFGNLRPGQSILIQSAAGGVGWAATQLARLIDNVTIFGTSSLGKHNAIEKNGVTYPIDYRTKDFIEEVRLIAPSGVDVILDCLSGNDFIRSQKILKNMGRLIHIGISRMITGEKRNLWNVLKVWFQTKNISIFNLIEQNHSICGLNVANLNEHDPGRFKFALKEVLKLYQEGKIKPKIDSVWNFNQIIDATKQLVDRKNIGKIILVPELEKHESSCENNVNTDGETNDKI